MPQTSSRKRSARALAALFSTFAAAAAGCAASGPRPIEFETGPRAEVTAEGLRRVKNPRFREAWWRPDAELASYQQILLTPLELSYKDEPTATVSERSVRNNFALREAQERELGELFLEVFISEFDASPYFRVAEQPGPGVLRAAARIVDLVVKVPTEVRGNERTFTNSTADMTLLLELHDSETGTILARMSDRRDALAAGHGVHGNAGDLYLSNPATDTGALRLTFRRWAKLLRERLDELHELEAAQN